jgi:hypothetical protein
MNMSVVALIVVAGLLLYVFAIATLLEINTFVRWTALYVSIAFVVLMAMGAISEWPKFYNLSKYGTVVVGQVVSKNCPENGFFVYQFSVDGHSFENHGQRGIATDCKNLNVGDPVTIAYLPSDPGVNASGQPDEWLRELSRGMGIATIVFSFVFLISIRNGRRWLSRRRANAA